MQKRFIFTNEKEAAFPEKSLFESIKNHILGRTYELSLTVVDPEFIRRLNRIYRGKNSPTDILSFPISGQQGEIYICPEESFKESKKFNRPYQNFLAFLFIHGCVHLKGYDHSGKMESVEEEVRNKFKI